jgi:hypothetical protein
VTFLGNSCFFWMFIINNTYNSSISDISWQIWFWVDCS